MAYIVPTSIAYPPTGDQVGTTERAGDRYGYVPVAALAPRSVPTTGQIWPRGNP